MKNDKKESIVHDPIEQRDDKYNSFLSLEFIQFQLRGDTSGTDVNFIIVRIAVQLDLHAVYSTVQLTGTEIICSVHNTIAVVTLRFSTP